MKLRFILAIAIILSSAARADISRLDPPDPRLQKPVSLDVSHVKLEDVAKSLTEQSGVEIKAGTGRRDWKVRETHVTIHAKDMALGKMMNEISRTLSFYVSREGKQGEWTYAIWQDKKSRDLESEMVTAQKEAAAQYVRDLRQAALDGADKALKMTPDEAMKQKDKDPWMAYMGGTKSGRGLSSILSAFGSQFPTEYDLMMRGKLANISVSAMSPTLRRSVNDACTGGFASIINKQSGDQGQQDLKPSEITIMPLEASGNGDQSMGMMGMSGVVVVTGSKPGASSSPYGGMMGLFFMVSPNSAAANALGEAMLALDSGVPLEQVAKNASSKFESRDSLAEALGHHSSMEKDPPTDPELTREVEIKADALPKWTGALVVRSKDQETQGKVIAEISRALGEPVLYESFDQVMPLSLFVKAGKQPLYKVLIALENADYAWERGDGALRIRPHDWALKRSYAISESFIAYYHDLLETKGEFSLDDLAGLATSLTDDQIQHTLFADPKMGFLSMSLSGTGLEGSRYLLRVYGTLTADQKQALVAEDGLPFNHLTDAQWDQLNAIITDHFGGIYVSGGTIRMVPQDESEMKQANLTRAFVITVQVTGEKDPRRMIQAVYVPNKSYIAGLNKATEAASAQQNKPAQQPQTPPKPAH